MKFFGNGTNGAYLRDVLPRGQKGVREHFRLKHAVACGCLGEKFSDPVSISAPTAGACAARHRTAMRRPRLELPGIPQHITHRGVNRGATFIDEEDFAAYLQALELTSREQGVAVHGYVLMTNHVQKKGSENISV